MTQPKTFYSKINDEYGGEYPQAIVVIRGWSISHQETGKSVGGVAPYDVNSDVGGLSYSLSYHYNEGTRSQGKKLRPLYFEDGDTMSDVLEVDLSNDEVIAALNSPGDALENRLRAIEIDVMIKFNPPAE